MALHPQTVLSLCSGYEGLGLGLKLADERFVTACYVEREASAARILVSRIEDGILDDAPIWSDLKTFRGKPWRGRIHTLTAGYPCQPFSCAGKQLAAKDPRHLWPHVARIIREVQPQQVFLENVDAHLRLGFHEVSEELAGMDYRVACGLFSAEEVGVPHRRLRLFALADLQEPRGRRLSKPDGRHDTADSDRRGAELADGYGPGRRIGRIATQERNVFDSRGAELANAPCERYPLRSDGQHKEEEFAASLRGSLPIFPPGPADLEAWSRLLVFSPDVEPAVCRDAHERAAGLYGRGASSRVPRLRALGNGVVPLVAACAYSVLRADLDASRVTP